jgi:hypothetical protein
VHLLNTCPNAEQRSRTQAERDAARGSGPGQAACNSPDHLLSRESAEHSSCNCAATAGQASRRTNERGLLTCGDTADGVLMVATPVAGIIPADVLILQYTAPA